MVNLLLHKFNTYRHNLVWFIQVNPRGNTVLAESTRDIPYTYASFIHKCPLLYYITASVSKKHHINSGICQCT